MPISAKYVKFYRGTQTAYNNIAKKDPEALYFIYPEVPGEASKLYLGTNLISGGNASDIDLNDLNDILLNQVAGKHILIYNDETQKWENALFSDILKTVRDAVFIGANADANTNGSIGLVPSPTAEQANYFLRGDGTWASPPSSMPSAVNKEEFTFNREGELTLKAVPAKKINGLVDVLKNEFVAVESNKGLSTNDFTDDLKTKLETLNLQDITDLKSDVEKFDKAITDINTIYEILSWDDM